MNHKREASLRIGVFLFDELVVAGSAAELIGKAAFDEFSEVTKKIVHPLARKFFIAPDLVKMQF